MVGWARGGTLSRLARLPLKASLLLVTAVLLVLAARLPGIPREAGGTLTGAGYVAALGALWFNRAIPWCPAVLVGAALNCAVILANHGRMPVVQHPLGQTDLLRADAGTAVLDSQHVLATPHTPLALLGDSIPLGLGGHGLVASPGDLLMALGIAALLQAGMRAEDSSA
jgi:hypothetical protein